LPLSVYGKTAKEERLGECRKPSFSHPTFLFNAVVRLVRIADTLENSDDRPTNSLKFGQICPVLNRVLP
jgi:hypothetical protein